MTEEEKIQQEINQRQKTTSLEDFNWDDNDDFIPASTSDDEVIDDDKKVIEKITKEKDLEWDADDDGSDDDSNDDDTTKDDKTVVTKTNTNDDVEEDTEVFTTLFKGLKEKGIFTSEITDDEKLDEETFTTKIDSEIQTRSDEYIESFIEDLQSDEDAAAFIRFKKNGGDTKEFLRVYGLDAEVPELDSDDEDSSSDFIKYYYKNIEKLSYDDVEEKLEWYKEKNKLKEHSEKLKQKIDTYQQKEKEELIRKQAEQIKSIEENNKKFITSIKDTVSKVDNVKDFKITQTDKKELVDFITKPTIKVGKDNYITPFSNALKTIMASEDRSKLILIAKLLKNDFDITDIVKEVNTKVVKETKTKLSELSKIVKPTSQEKRKSLADYF